MWYEPTRNFALQTYGIPTGIPVGTLPVDSGIPDVHSSNTYREFGLNHPVGPRSVLEARRLHSCRGMATFGSDSDTRRDFPRVFIEADF